MRVIPDARAITLEPLLTTLIVPGATVITDGHAGHQHTCRLGYVWERRPHPPLAA